MIGVSASAAVSDCSDADAAALKLLDKMSKSLRLVSYEGVVTLQRNHETQVMQVSHSVNGGRSYERLTELTGQGAQVERSSHPVDCIHPGDRLLRLETLSTEDRCGIAEQYRFRVLDTERVAGRNAMRIKIEPRDVYRYGYVMALDRDTGLMLKSQTLDHSQQILETMQFAHLSYTDVGETAGRDPANVAPTVTVDDIEVIHEAQHPQAEGVEPGGVIARAWTVGWLPRGFAATDPAVGNQRRRTYTDGLAVFSVFLEALDVEIRPGEGLIRQGGTTTYTRGLRVADQPVLVTVIGEVPGNTARMVADSVRWVQ
jgi:sigma-E factor negative regulatory protein RseB